MPKESNIDKALRLHKEADAAKKAAIGDLLQQRTAIDAKLQRLGYEEGAPRVRRGRPAGKKAVRARVAARASKLCKICGKPGHDGRKHRWDKKDAKK